MHAVDLRGDRGESAMKRQRWEIGDLFTVPLPDDTASLGQIVARETQALNSVTCAFFSTRFNSDVPEPTHSLGDLIACLFITPDLLNNGVWQVIGHADVTVPRHLFPFEETRDRGWVGAKVYGSKNVAEFLAAYHGLTAWDDWADPTYLDRLLISPDKKPKKIILKRG
jgi:hypothetical protein